MKAKKQVKQLVSNCSWLKDAIEDGDMKKTIKNNIIYEADRNELFEDMVFTIGVSLIAEYCEKEQMKRENI